MTVTYLSYPWDQATARIIRATFPSYSGRKAKLSTSIPSRLDSYFDGIHVSGWDGGSKDEFCFYQLSTGITAGVASNHPVFEAANPRDLGATGLPSGIILVCHSYFCGKDCGITIYANSSDLTPMLPVHVELTWAEAVVLSYTSRFKSSYQGRAIRLEYAQDQTKITVDQWKEAKEGLILRKLLTKAGAITAEGRNALSAYAANKDKGVVNAY